MLMNMPSIAALRRHPECHSCVAARLRPPAVVELQRAGKRQSRRHHDMLDLERMSAGRDAPAVTGIDGRNPRIFEDARPGRCARGRKTGQVLHGIELRLVGKLQRARRVEGQRSPVQHARLEAEDLRGLRLALDIGAAVGIAGKRIGVLRFRVHRQGKARRSNREFADTPFGLPRHSVEPGRGHSVSIRCA